MKTRPKPPNAGKGRVKGVPNKVTKDVRACYSAFAQNRAEDFDTWVSLTANGIKGKKGWIVKPDPARAADLYLKATEYHLPKIQRIEHTGAGGGPVALVTADKNDLKL
jgi:hypothetical protein